MTIKNLTTTIKALNRLIKNEGIAEYIRDYYAAINGRLNILAETNDFYIAEDFTYQPWLSVMGNLPQHITEKELLNLLKPYVENQKCIAVYTNFA